MRSFLFIITIVFLQLCSPALAQNKSDLKKYAISSFSTELIDDSGKFIERTEKYYPSGLLAETIEYDKDGSVKKRVLFVYDKKGNIIDETEFKADRMKHRFVSEYNGPGSKKSAEFEYLADASLKSKKLILYNRMGDKIEEQVYDKQNTLIEKSIWTYDSKGFKKEKSQYDGAGNLLNSRKYTYSVK